MGLDITAYRKVRLMDTELTRKDEDYYDFVEENGGFTTYVNEAFPGRADPILDGRGYETDEEAFGFRAGSYSGYNDWRNQLAELAGYACVESERPYRGKELRCDESAFNADSGPFHELISFSDCEGIIGSVAAKKLAKDFADFQEKADSFGDEYFRRKYADWRKACEMAADDGCIKFH